MSTALGVVLGIAALLTAVFAVAMRWGQTFPRVGRWLDRMLGTSWFKKP